MYATMCRMDRFVNSWLRGQDGVLYTPKGLAWQGKWGTLRHTAAAAFLLLAYAHGKPSMDFDRVQSITCFAHQQVSGGVLYTGPVLLGWLLCRASAT